MVRGFCLLIYQLNKGFHLGCEPFVLVIEQLPVHGDSAVGDMEAGDTPGGEGRTCLLYTSDAADEL